MMKITTLFTLVLIATTNGNVQGGGQGGGIVPGGTPPEIPGGVPGGVVACNACGMMALQQGCQRACSIPMCSGLLCMQLCPKVVNACKGSVPGK